MSGPETESVPADRVTVTPADASRQYGDANPALTGTITGLVNNDAITATYTTTAVQSSPVVTYPITAALNDPSRRDPWFDLRDLSLEFQLTAPRTQPAL